MTLKQYKAKLITYLEGCIRLAEYEEQKEYNNYNTHLMNNEPQKAIDSRCNSYGARQRQDILKNIIDDIKDDVISTIIEESDDDTYEVCPHCENEVKLVEAKKKVYQECPVCKKKILPCSLCEQEEMNCGECQKEK